jgi:hypothetical protein
MFQRESMICLRQAGLNAFFTCNFWTLFKASPVSNEQGRSLAG